jgi:acetyltransferase
LSGAAADEMMRALRGYPLLTGTRGELGVDLRALRRIIVRCSHLVKDFCDLVELDINPLIIPAGGARALIVDARLRLGPSQTAIAIGIHGH